jgi:hypothetical protein
MARLPEMRTNKLISLSGDEWRKKCSAIEDKRLADRADRDARLRSVVNAWVHGVHALEAVNTALSDFYSGTRPEYIKASPDFIARHSEDLQRMVNNRVTIQRSMRKLDDVLEEYYTGPDETH